ncbi:NAD(P)-binding protein [Xylaria bambusicola]|uniref:NAD(P)-binding protein n=1 Tax=Xylaria bambusicola TaxID=326684 RepID=UPI00200854DD|nr:NAD(P)-binding protein [Xylaria bambusicola]KAI0523815.1 NAD(P)-binding protein [Xylaria bambusicola]
MLLDPARLTNWPAIRDFVPTAHQDTYPFISTGAVDLGGKSVFITGASRGIGKGVALSFARAGCSRIAVAARRGVEELKQEILSAAEKAGRPKPHVLPIALDVTSEAGVNAAASAVADAFSGVLDILISNAGHVDAMVPLPESDPAEWWRTWDVNIRATYLCTRAFLPLLLKSSIRTVLITSSAGAHMLIGNMLGYQTTKTALCRYAEFLAKEYEEEELVVLAVHPGDVLTGMAGIMGEEMAAIFKDKPELTGDSLVWLAKERRTWLSGRFVSVTWDMQELEQKKEEIIAKDLLKFRLTV